MSKTINRNEWLNIIQNYVITISEQRQDGDATCSPIKLAQREGVRCYEPVKHEIKSYQYSKMSLYKVCDLFPGNFFRARSC